MIAQATAQPPADPPGASARSKAGASNRSRGHAFMRLLVTQLREQGYWPNASIETRHRSHDIFGIGDVGLEVTIEAWSEIDRKVRQAKADAAARGVEWWSVIKRRRGARTPLDGYAVTEARVFVALLCRLQKLEAEAESTEAAYRRGRASALLESIPDPGYAPHDEGTSYCTNLPEHEHPGQDPAGLAC